jgi:hypothetical protein
MPKPQIDTLIKDSVSRMLDGDFDEIERTRGEESRERSRQRGTDIKCLQAVFYEKLIQGTYELSYVKTEWFNDGTTATVLYDIKTSKGVKRFGIVGSISDDGVEITLDNWRVLMGTIYLSQRQDTSKFSPYCTDLKVVREFASQLELCGAIKKEMGTKTLSEYQQELDNLIASKCPRPETYGK